MYGKILKELRIENKLTQQKFAEIFQISPKSVSKYENEQLDLNTELIMKNSKYINVSADYLLGLEN